MELESQRKSLKLRNKKKSQRQKKLGISGATPVELRDLADDTVTILPRDVSYRNLREDGIIKVNIDTSNDRIESSVDASTDIDIDVSEPSTKYTAEDADDISSTNESVKAGIDNIPTKKSKKGKKKKVTSKKARNSLNSTGTTDSLNQSTLDSILVGIEEYLQDDDSKDNEDIKVNVIKDEAIEDKQTTDNEDSKISYTPSPEKRFDEEKENIETVNKPTQEVFNADVANADYHAKQYHADSGEVERTVAQENNKTLKTDKESIGHKPRGLDEEEENAEIAIADSPLQNGTEISKSDISAMDRFHFNTGEFKGADSGEGQQTNTAQEPKHPLNVEVEDEDNNRSHALELQVKENEKPITANPKNDENAKNVNGIVTGKNTTVEEDPNKHDADIGSTANRTGRTSEGELQDNAAKIPLEAVESQKGNSTSQEVGTGNTTDQPAVVKNNKVSGIEGESTLPKDRTLGGYKEDSKTGYALSLIHI